MKKNFTVKLWGKITGNIWMPNCECEKDFSFSFSTNPIPFQNEWCGIRDALLTITNDGGFQSCDVSELFGEVVYYESWGKVTKYLKFNHTAKEYSDCLAEDFSTD
jgi:hypothetical protein